MGRILDKDGNIIAEISSKTGSDSVPTKNWKDCIPTPPKQEPKNESKESE